MIYINHRVNTLGQLAKVPSQNGAEIDIRYHENELILHHDPFEHHTKKSLAFETFLKNWKNEGPLILNVKTEGVEKKCIELMNNYQVTNWFFLDLSMPYFAIYAQKTEGSIPGFSGQNLAVRFSEREPIEYALSFAGKAGWVWVDCFTRFCLSKEDYKRLKTAGFQFCLVSPELQGHPLQKIREHLKMTTNMQIDAVCTKRPDLWGQELPAPILKQLQEDYPLVTDE